MKEINFPIWILIFDFFGWKHYRTFFTERLPVVYLSALSLVSLVTVETLSTWSACPIPAKTFHFCKQWTPRRIGQHAIFCLHSTHQASTLPFLNVANLLARLFSTWRWFMESEEVASMMMYCMGCWIWSWPGIFSASSVYECLDGTRQTASSRYCGSIPAQGRVQRPLLGAIDFQITLGNSSR